MTPLSTSPASVPSVTERTVREKPILFSGSMVCGIIEDRKGQTRRTRGLDRINAAPDDWQLEGLVTRTVPSDAAKRGTWCFAHRHGEQELAYIRCPYGRPGDRLWVRETWAAEFNWPDERGDEVRSWEEMPAAFRGLKSLDRVYFAADQTVYAPTADRAALTDGPVGDADSFPEKLRFRPSIFMPRWASRITLEITEVRVERVQEITNDDARSEGVPECDTPGHDDCFYGASGQAYQCGFQVLWDSINASRGYGWDANPYVWAITFKRLDTPSLDHPHERLGDER